MAPTARLTRRQLVAVGLAGPLSTPAAALAHAGDDSQALGSALAVEVLVVFTYEELLDTHVLGRRAARAARGFLAQEHAHVRTLAAAVGEPAPQPPASVAQADKELAARKSSGSLAAVHTAGDALRLLYDVESIAVGAYYEALAKLSDPAKIRIATEIMGSEAQHAAAIGVLIHPHKIDRAVPVSSVKGKR